MTPRPLAAAATRLLLSFRRGRGRNVRRCCGASPSPIGSRRPPGVTTSARWSGVRTRWSWSALRSSTPPGSSRPNRCFLNRGGRVSEKSLAALAEHQTERVGVRQDHLTRRINQVFPDEVDTTVEEWVTAHTDLHWGNLTAPDCYLLDWEDWGAAPRGYDAAVLWGFSYRFPGWRITCSASFRPTCRPGRVSSRSCCSAPMSSG